MKGTLERVQHKKRTQGASKQPTTFKLSSCALASTTKYPQQPFSSYASALVFLSWSGHDY